MSGGPRSRISRAGGFVLVELLVAVAIAATLASITVPGYLHHLHRARAARIIGDWAVVRHAVSEVLLETDDYPADVLRYRAAPGLEDLGVRWHPDENGDFGYDWNNWSSGDGVVGLSVYTTNRMLVWHLDRQFTGPTWIGKRGELYHFMFRLR